MAGTATRAVTGGEGKSLEERVGRLEWQHEATEKRLNEGAKTFGEIQKTLKAQNQPAPWYRTAGLAIVLATLIGAWIWQAARYPDREEFNTAQKKTQVQQRAMENNLNDLKIDQVKIRADVNTIKASQVRTEKATDDIKTDIRALSRTRRRR